MENRQETYQRNAVYILAAFVAVWVTTCGTIAYIDSNRASHEEKMKLGHHEVAR